MDPDAPEIVGRYSITAAAADLNTIASWLDAVTADPHFDDAWINGVTTALLVDGTKVVQFTADVLLTEENLVQRSYTAANDKESA